MLSAHVCAEEAVLTAKIWASDVAHRVSQSSQHLHGGIGVDRDYPLFRFCLWAKQLELMLGGGNSYLSALGDAIADEFKQVEIIGTKPIPHCTTTDRSIQSSDMLAGERLATIFCR
jgi:hypothetical protein